MIIFLDFDGVLHPDSVYRPRNKPLALRAEGSLFMHARHIRDCVKSPPGSQNSALNELGA